MKKASSDGLAFFISVKIITGIEFYADALAARGGV